MNRQTNRGWPIARNMATYDLAILIGVGALSALSDRLNAFDYGTDLITTCFIIMCIGVLSITSGWCTTPTLWTQISPPLTYHGVRQDAQAFAQSQPENYRLCLWTIAGSIVPMIIGLLLRSAGA